MTYRELYDKAEWKLEHGKINGGEFDEMTKPLDEEIRTWIPCSERLPEEDGKYLVTMNGYVSKKPIVGTSIFVTSTKEWYPNCIAWMPLPEPYKEEGEAE